MMPPPHGFTVGTVCGNPLCFEPEHLQFQRWNTFGGRFTDYAERIAALKIDESLDFPEITDAKDFSINVRSAVVMRTVKYIVRTLPKGGGIRVIRLGDWFGEISEKVYPVLAHRQAAPCNSLRPGAFFLGFVCFSSLHRKDIPKQQRCKAKACAFPANGNSEGLCHHHFHFFDYSISRLGRHIDMEDIYGDDKSAPRFYVSWFWKHQSERLKFQQGGSTSWWQNQVLNAQRSLGERIASKVDARCAEKRVYDTKREADAVVREMRDDKTKKRPTDTLRSYKCEVCNLWHVGNDNSVFQIMAKAPARMGQSVPGLHRGVSGLHHGKHPRNRIGRCKASQKARWKTMVANAIGNKRTPQKPEKRWSRGELEAQADSILAEAGFFEEVSESVKETCTRKIRYASRKVASLALRSMAQKADDSLEIYRCPNCNGWHLGNHWTPQARLESESVTYDSSEARHEAIELWLTEEQDREFKIAQLSGQQNEFAEIFGA